MRPRYVGMLLMGLMTTGRRIAGLELIVGPMFSGKTAELIRRLSNWNQSGLRVVAAKPSIDRDPQLLVSLTGAQWPAIPVTDAEGLVPLVGEADVLGIDELQFFDRNIVTVVRELRGRVRIAAAGLDLDFRGEPFRSVRTLVSHADNVSELSATCQKCGLPASRTQRLANGDLAPRSGPTIQIGGFDLYEPRCEGCFVIPR
jgi:thymidine kinase